MKKIDILTVIENGDEKLFKEIVKNLNQDTLSKYAFLFIDKKVPSYFFKKLLNHLNNVNITEKSKGDTLLIRSIKKGSRYKTFLILNKNPDVNILNKIGESPLWCLLKLNKENFNGLILDKLLSLKPDVNLKRKISLVHCAQRNKDDSGKVLEKILKAGANVNVIDSNGYSPLSNAVYGNKLKNIELLVKYGARDIVDGGYSVLGHCFKMKDTPVIDVLLKSGLDTSGFDLNGRDLFRNALLYNYKKIAKVIWDNQKPDPFLKDKDGMTIFHIAGASGNYEIFNQLLDYNYDINIKDNNGSTPVAKLFNRSKKTITKNDWIVLNKLVEKNFDFYEKDNFGNSVLSIISGICKKTYNELIIKIVDLEKKKILKNINSDDINNKEKTKKRL